MHLVTKADSGIVAIVLGVLLVAGCGPSSPNTDASPVPAEVSVPAVPSLVLQPEVPAGLAGVLMFHSDRNGRHKLFTLDLATAVVTR